MATRRPRGYVEKRKYNNRARYYPVLNINGQRKYHGGFKRKGDAEEYLRQLKDQVINGTYGKEDLTFQELYNKWIEAKRRSLKPSTLLSCESTFKKHVLPSLGNKLLSTLTTLDIQKWVDETCEKDLSPATVQKAYRYVRACLNQARDWDLLEKNICRGIVLPRVEKKELDYLEPKEIQQLLDVITDPSDKALFTTLAFSGVRYGEALGFAWRHVDFDNGVLVISRSAYWLNGNLQTPKSEASRRAVPLLPTLADVLKDYFEYQGKPNPDYLLFSYDGQSPFDQSDTRKRFNSYLEKAGLRHVQIHSLRHSFATILLAAGGSIKATQRALGHASAAMTLDVYSHLIPEDLGDTVNKADAILSGNGGRVVQLKQSRQSR